MYFAVAGEAADAVDAVRGKEPKSKEHRSNGTNKRFIITFVEL
jgi:hypothetical protein